MTITQRSALARAWLADSKTAEEDEEPGEVQEVDNSSSPGSDDDTNSSSDGGGPPDLLETWLILEVRSDQQQC